MIEDSRLRRLADTAFRYTSIKSPPVVLISRIRDRLTAGRWSTTEILRITNSLENRLSSRQREIIRDEKRALEQLRSDEKEDKAKIRGELKKLDGNFRPADTLGYNNFITSYLSKLNSERREAIADDLLESLSRLESTFTQSSHEFNSLEYAVNNDDEEVALDELSDLYQHLVKKGWHYRDVSDPIMGGIIGENFLEELRNMVNKERERVTYVCYLENITFLIDREPNIDDLTIISGEDLSVDRLAEEYPYDKDEFDYVSPDVHEILDKEELSVVIFSIKQFGSRGGTETARERLSEILDMFSFADTRADMEDPHLADWFQYTSWRPTAAEAHLSLSKTRESRDTARVVDFQVDELEEVIFPVLELDRDTNSLVDVFRRGLHLYRRGNTTNRDVNKVIGYVSCLETIADPGNTYSEERIDNLLTVGGIQDHVEPDIVKDALYARNDALHSGISPRNLDQEVALLRTALKNALFQLGKFILSSDGDTVQDYIDHRKEQTHNARKKQQKMIEDSGFPKNQEVPFTTEFDVGRRSDREDIHVQMHGNLKFEIDDDHLATYLEFTESTADSEGNFTQLTHPELTLRTDHGEVSIQLNRIPGWVGSAISTGTFEYLSPWKTYAIEFDIE